MVTVSLVYSNISTVLANNKLAVKMHGTCVYIRNNDGVKLELLFWFHYTK